MSILINHSTRVVVQGITGYEGSFQAKRMIEYGTNVVAGVSPGKGGSWVAHGRIPVFDTMQSAVEMTEANTSVIFVPARQALDCLYEAADSGVQLVICITEGIPLQDTAKACAYMESKGVRLIGPNCCGIIAPGEQKIGLIPGDCAIPGNIGVISRSGTLCYLTMQKMKENGLGVSTCVGIGGDMLVGTTFVEVMEMFENDPYTDAVLLLGEIGGLEEERAAKYAAYRMSKPVVAYIAGDFAIPGRHFGHAGAFIESGVGYARAKLEAFQSSGIPCTVNYDELIDLLRKQVTEEPH